MDIESPESTGTKNSHREKTLGSNQVSLVFMLLLFTCAAIVASFIQMSAMVTQKSPSVMPLMSLKTGVITCILGAIVGFVLERRLVSAAIGCITGFGVGAIAGVVGAIPGELSSRMNQIAFIGSLVMIAIVLVSSQLTKRIDGSRLPDKEDLMAHEVEEVRKLVGRQ